MGFDKCFIYILLLHPVVLCVARDVRPYTHFWVELIATRDFPNMAKHRKTQPDIGVAISWTRG
jgi:hypothetical protein